MTICINQLFKEVPWRFPAINDEPSTKFINGSSTRKTKGRWKADLGIDMLIISGKEWWLFDDYIIRTLSIPDDVIST